LQDVGIDPEQLDEMQRQCLLFKKIEQGPGALTADDVLAMYRDVM